MPAAVTTRLAAPLALVVALAGAGCAAKITCGTGTHEVGGVCALNDGGSPATDAGSDAGPSADAGSDAGEPDAGSESCSPACSAGFLCYFGACVPVSPPARWTCSAARFADGVTCDCGCGAPDPDCGSSSLPVGGCPGADPRCTAEGTCTACVPACDGRQCGPDSCGGYCGSCPSTAPSCLGGQCHVCTPACTDLQCGPDGCGGTCGTCGEGTECSNGLCVPPPANASCVGLCGSVAASGCSCEANCAQARNCCLDINVCGCIPDCAGRTCGDNGCGGSCGGCDPGQMCSTSTCVTDPCAPDPCHGNGICSEPAGACACNTGYAGTHCDGCATGYVNYPLCVVDLCLHNSVACDAGTCDPLTGLCVTADGGN
jgi:hypothetical protein